MLNRYFRHQAVQHLARLRSLSLPCQVTASVKKWCCTWQALPTDQNFWECLLYLVHGLSGCTALCEATAVVE
jgi:predicted HNH restriction endonuclease